jgi:hypothetical protein
MAKPYGRRRSSWKRNAQSGGMQALGYTGRTVGKAVEAVGRWATTDHTGITQTLSRMPPMGFRDTLVYTLIHLVLGVLGAVLTGAWIAVLIAYGIPFLITGHF